MLLVRSSNEPESETTGTSDQTKTPAPSSPPRLSLVPRGPNPESGPEGGSGEWLQQYAWALEDNNLEQAAWLLKWIFSHGEAWAIAQAADLAIERLAQVPEGKGAAAALVRLYHALGPLFPEAHAFHGAFLSRLEAQVRSLVAGPQAMTAATAIERALELFRSHLSHHQSYATLREALADLQQRSRLVVQHEKERELEELLATGDTFRAVELCRELIEAFQSPLASGLMPTLLVQAGTLQREASALAGRRAKEWDWPELGAAEGDEAIRFNPRTGRPYATETRIEVEPPSKAWSRAFDAPNLGQQATAAADESTSAAHEAAVRSHFSTFVYPQAEPASRPAPVPAPAGRSGTGRPTAGPTHGLEPDLSSLPEVQEREADAQAGPMPVGTPGAQIPGVKANAAWRWVAMLVVVLIAALIGWLLARNDQPEKPAPAPDTRQSQAGLEAPGEKRATETTVALMIPDPGATEATGRLTLEMTPNDKLELYVDGVLQPDGKVESLPLVPGLHTIEAFREEHERFTQQVYVGASGETRVQVTLARSPRMNVSVEPPDGLDVRLDDRRLTLAPPLNGYVISPGKHRLEVSRPGFQTHVQEFTAVTGANLNFQIELASRAP